SLNIGEGAEDSRKVTEHVYEVPPAIGEEVSDAKNPARNDIEVLTRVREAVTDEWTAIKDNYKDVKIISDVNSNVKKETTIKSSTQEDFSWR
ncbi:hypothetical protein GCK32_010801, partial [Trichostrongylus colubriformis]